MKGGERLHAIPQYIPPPEKNTPLDIWNPKQAPAPTFGYQGKNNTAPNTEKPAYQGNSKFDPLINLQVYQQTPHKQQRGTNRGKYNIF